MSWKDLYPSRSSVSLPVTSPVTANTVALNLREEFRALVEGRGGEVPIGQPLILRRMRRDSAGGLVPCSCVDPVTHEPQRDFPCALCQGRGYLWDEVLVTGYKIIVAAPAASNASVNLRKEEAGHLYLPAARFFFPYDVTVTRDDRVVEIELDADGNAVVPYNRLAIYELTLVRALRGDNGKIEYWACTGQKLGPETHGTVG